ncbi:glucokinase [Salegentibacter sediminis]|uniref:glucokinase n=1 Tax=Salegentibacter sediminis TaxID=1930251 RepID=UPI0009C13179|nr:glucokinase [Salegentibacter sediminis]
MDRIITFNKESEGFYFPLSFQGKETFEQSEGVILAGDVGGTKTNLALFQFEKDSLKPIKQESFKTNEWTSFPELMSSFHSNELPAIDTICLGVAGPVIGGKVVGTNFAWELDEKDIARALKVKRVSIINDMEANAYGLSVLSKKNFAELKKGNWIRGNAAIISPGTGLGEVGLYWDGSHYHPFASEGGHSDFCQRSELDFNFWRFLHKKYGHVSWERIISGPGIVNIYEFLLKNKNISEPENLKDKIKEGDPAAVISQCAKEESFEICKETMELFIEYLATEAAQMALKFKALGGIFIGGGILPKIIDLVDKDVFLHHFVQSNRMNPLLEKIPVNVILNEESPLFGAAFCAARNLPEK